MTTTASHLNTLDRPSAIDTLRRCCASQRWAERMADARPFDSDDELLGAARRLWWALEPDDWLEAFAAHPRIGESSQRPDGGWSSQEQSGMNDADQALHGEIHRLNQAYEQRFGHVFLICATGRSGGEMLDALRARLSNDRDTELRIAAEQQTAITALRLRKLEVTA